MAKTKLNPQPLPKKIIIKTHGASSSGYLAATGHSDIPFVPKNIFWTYYTPQSIIRGRHAHKKTTIILFALAGKIIVTTETLLGIKKTFVLDKPNVGLVIPPMVWHTQRYSHTAVQLALSSHTFESKEYIRSYIDFKKLQKKTSP
jgi:dTDP-4-dehydrorhamnose 3,5-epimerase-like enzyme